MQNISDNSEIQTFRATCYTIRGRLFAKNRFEIQNPSGETILVARPPAIISSEISLYSTDGKRLITCQNRNSMKDAYISGTFSYDVRDCATKKLMGGLVGLANDRPEGVAWQIYDPQRTRIGHITQEATPPEARYGGKPMYNLLNGFIGKEPAFVFSVDVNSFRFTMSANFSVGTGAIDRRFGLALAVLFSWMKRTRSSET